MKAEEFVKIEGFWNGKLYSGNRVFKNNQQYVIDDPENLELKNEPEKKDFYDLYKEAQEKVDNMINAYNSMNDAKRSIIRGSNHKSDILGDPYQTRHEIRHMIENLLLLEKRINSEVKGG